MVMVRHRKSEPDTSVPTCRYVLLQEHRLSPALVATQHSGLTDGLRQHKGKTGKFLT